MNESRVSYAVHTVEALCHLVQSTQCNEDMKAGIEDLAGRMLQMVWDVEVKMIRSYQLDREKKAVLVRDFWDGVSQSLDSAVVGNFIAVWGESVNPNGELGVCVKVQPSKRAELLVITLREA